MFSRKAFIRLLLALWLVFGLLSAGVPVRAAVTLLSFRATAREGEVVIDWATATELDNAGFYVRRSYAENGPFTRVSPFVPSQGEPLTGTTYSWTDGQVVDGTIYWYQLESVDLSQNSEFYGPISATPGSTDPTVTPSATSTQTPTVTPTGPTSSPSMTNTPTTPAATSQPSTAYPAPATITPFPTVVQTAVQIPTITPFPSLPPAGATAELPTVPAFGTSTLVPLPALTLVFPEGGIVVGGTATATQAATPLPAVDQGPGWSPLGAYLLVGILVLIWGLLGAAFYFSFQRIT